MLGQFISPVENRPVQRLSELESEEMLISYVPLYFSEGSLLPLTPESMMHIRARRVIIEGLPDALLDTRNLTPFIRGGQVIRVEMDHGPGPRDNTATVEFAKHSVAMEYYTYMRQNAVRLLGVGVQVFLSNSVIPIRIHDNRNLNYGITRLLVRFNAHDFEPMSFFNDFRENHMDPLEVLEDAWIDEDKTLFLLFIDIEDAGRYYKDIISRKLIQGEQAVIDDQHFFTWDPCDGPVTELDEPTWPARDNHDSQLQLWMKSRDSDYTFPYLYEEEYNDDYW